MYRNQQKVGIYIFMDVWIVIERTVSYPRKIIMFTLTYFAIEMLIEDGSFLYRGLSSLWQKKMEGWIRHYHSRDSFLYKDHIIWFCLITVGFECKEDNGYRHIEEDLTMWPPVGKADISEKKKVWCRNGFLVKISMFFTKNINEFNY